MVSALRHTEPRHPRFGLRLRRKGFSCRLWDAIQAAIGSEDRRNVDASVSLIRLYEKEACRPKLSRSWKKQPHSLPSPTPGFVGACVCRLRPERKGFPPSSKPRQKRKLPHYSVCLNLRLVLSDKEKACSPRKGPRGAIHFAHLQQDGSEIRSYPLRCALHRYSAAHRASSVSFAAA